MYWSEFSGSAWGTNLNGVVLCTPLVVICTWKINENFTFVSKKKKKKKNISPLAFLYQHSTFSYFFPLKSTQSLLLPNSISQFQLRTKRSKLHFYLVVAMKIENPLHKFNEKPSQTHAQLTNSIKHQICHTHPSDIMNFKPKSNTNPDHNSIKTTRKQRERQVKKKKNKNAHSIINYWLVRNSQNAGDFRFSPSDPQINRLLAIITNGYAIGSYNFIGIVEVLEFNVDPYPHTNFSFAANERREKHDIERERERERETVTGGRRVRRSTSNFIFHPLCLL
jgi:hypothetical protein